MLSSYQNDVRWPCFFEYETFLFQCLRFFVVGASEGKGKGRQVIACAKSADCVLMILDAAKYKDQREKILNELEIVGIRINREKPQISIKPTNGGGIQVMSPYKMTKCTNEDVKSVLKEYRINNAQVIFKDDYSVRDFVI